MHKRITGRASVSSPTMSTSTLMSVLKGERIDVDYVCPKAKPNTPKSSSRPNQIYRSASSDRTCIYIPAATLINYPPFPIMHRSMLFKLSRPLLSSFRPQPRHRLTVSPSPPILATLLRQLLPRCDITRASAATTFHLQ